MYLDNNIGSADAGEEGVAGGSKIGRMLAEVVDLTNANVHVQRVELHGDGLCAASTDQTHDTPS
jgi:hypothetical protein